MNKLEFVLKVDECFITAITRLATALENTKKNIEDIQLETIFEKSTVKTKQAQIEKAPIGDKRVNIEKVRAILAAKSQGGKQPEVKALIVKYGANKLTDIDPSHYEALLKEAEVL